MIHHYTTITWVVDLSVKHLRRCRTVSNTQSKTKLNIVNLLVLIKAGKEGPEQIRPDAICSVCCEKTLKFHYSLLIST